MNEVFTMIGGQARWAMLALIASMLTLAALPASARSLSLIQQEGTIRVGVLAENAPFGFVDEKGAMIGFNVDVADTIGRELGVKVEVISTTATSRIASLITGGIDISVATIGMLPKRAEVIQFSEPYTLFENLGMGAKDLAVSSLKDLSGLRVGVGQATSSEAFFLENAPPNTTVRSFANRAANIQALVAGQVDVICDDSLALDVLEKAAPGRFERKFVLSELWMGVAMAKGEPELLKAVNGAIDTMRENGELKAIHQKWLHTDGPAQWPSELPGVPFTVD